MAVLCLLTPVLAAVTAVELGRSHRCVLGFIVIPTFPGTPATEHLNLFLCYPQIFDKLSVKVFSQILTNLPVSSSNVQSS